MSEMAEDFKALNEMRRAKRGDNKTRSTELLKERGINFQSNNHGVHLVVRHNDVIYDFYPSTGLYINRATKKKGRGVFNLLKKLGV